MSTIREKIEEREKLFLSALAKKSSETLGRKKNESSCSIRTCFQVDRDRILHSKSFRRLKGKTQVLLLPKGDHYRTRMTHTLEVSQIARTISRALFLNEDLTEAISLGHDLGHTPFGHAGESALNRLIKKFHHAFQSLRVVEVLERDGEGLNLTYEVKDGILKHTKGLGNIIPNEKMKPETLEGMVVRFADIIAYLNHDLDDALRAEVIKMEDVPTGILKVLGETYGKRIDTMVRAVVEETLKEDTGEIRIKETVLHAMEELRKFLYERVYNSEAVTSENKKAERILEELFYYYLKNPEEFEKDSEYRLKEEKGIERIVTDFIAGMTDNFALWVWEGKFVPKPFSKV